MSPTAAKNVPPTVALTAGTVIKPLDFGPAQRLAGDEPLDLNDLGDVELGAPSSEAATEGVATRLDVPKAVPGLDGELPSWRGMCHRTTITVPSASEDRSGSPGSPLRR